METVVDVTWFPNRIKAIAKDERREGSGRLIEEQVGMEVDLIFSDRDHSYPKMKDYLLAVLKECRDLGSLLNLHLKKEERDKRKSAVGWKEESTSWTFRSGPRHSLRAALDNKQ